MEIDMVGHKTSMLKHGHTITSMWWNMLNAIKQGGGILVNFGLAVIFHICMINVIYTIHDLKFAISNSS